jgi:hypothetical protein
MTARALPICHLVNFAAAAVPASFGSFSLAIMKYIGIFARSQSLFFRGLYLQIENDLSASITRPRYDRSTAGKSRDRGTSRRASRHLTACSQDVLLPLDGESYSLTQAASLST